MIEILIGTKENNKKIALIENGNLVEYYEQEQNSNRTEGNLYVGIVKDLIKGMQAAFVDIGTEKNGFIHLKDLLPKVDETKEEVKKRKKASKKAEAKEEIIEAEVVEEKPKRTRKKKAETAEAETKEDKE